MHYECLNSHEIISFRQLLLPSSLFYLRFFGCSTLVWFAWKLKLFSIYQATICSLISLSWWGEPKSWRLGGLLRFVDPILYLLYLGSVINDSGFCLGDWFLFMSGVEDKFAEIVGESCLVGIETLLTFVLSPIINWDSNGFGKLNSQTYRLNLSKSESSSESGSVAISNGLASDWWSKFIERSGSKWCCLSSSGLKSSFLPACLIEPGSDVSLPMLPEMHIRDDVVMLNHWR